MLEGFLIGLFCLAIAFLAAEVWTLVRWRDGWRVAALLPAAVVCFVVARIVVDTRSDPTSHNLWPFEVIWSSALGLAFLGVLALARMIAGGRQSAS